jgi:hypothetical protein
MPGVMPENNKHGKADGKAQDINESKEWIS